MNQKLYGFFAYDLFPYCVHGEVTGINKDGMYHRKDVGWYRADAVLGIFPYKDGKRIATKVEELKEEYNKKEKALKKTYIEQVELLIKTKRL